MSAVRLLPWPLHEAIEYVVGVFFVMAPFLFGFRDEVAFPVFVGVGVVVLVVAILSRGPASVANVLPTAVHAGFDYVLGIFLIVAPFLFGYADVDAALVASIFLGLAHLVVSLVTKFPEAETSASA